MEELIESLREQLFHFNDEDARPIIDDFLHEHPELLTIHDIKWYYENV